VFEEIGRKMSDKICKMFEHDFVVAEDCFKCAIDGRVYIKELEKKLKIAIEALLKYSNGKSWSTIDIEYDSFKTYGVKGCQYAQDALEQITPEMKGKK